MRKFSIFMACTLLVIVGQVRGIMFFLKPSEEKCLKEVLQANQLLVGEYIVNDVAHQMVDYVARDSKGIIVSQKKNITKGRFSYSPNKDDTHEICFYSKVPQDVAVYSQMIALITKKGMEATEFQSVATSQKLQSLEQNLGNLESMASEIVKDFALVQRQERALSETNENTHKLLLYFNILSVCCTMGVALWQIYYLYRYFKAKKLID